MIKSTLSLPRRFKANPNMKLILLPDIQETSDVPCDTGTDPALLQKEIDEKGLPVDASLVHDGWNDKVLSLSALKLLATQPFANVWLIHRPAAATHPLTTRLETVRAMPDAG
jgi:hypothetical protein